MSQAMGELVEIRGKTEQRVAGVLKALRSAPKGDWLTYERLTALTGTPYDVLLYVLTTLCEVGFVERLEVAEKPGRPKVTFRWNQDEARALGARSA